MVVENGCRAPFLQAFVRRMFADFCGIEQDEDIINHDAPPDAVVTAFHDGDGPGPDFERPRFSMLSKAETLWNMTICFGLARRAWHKHPKDGPSFNYWQWRVVNKWVQVRKRWTPTMARSVPGPLNQQRLETPVEVVRRMEAHHDHETVIGNRRNRRIAVSELSLQDSTTDNVPSSVTGDAWLLATRRS